MGSRHTQYWPWGDLTLIFSEFMCTAHAVNIEIPVFPCKFSMASPLYGHIRTTQIYQNRLPSWLMSSYMGIDKCCSFPLQGQRDRLGQRASHGPEFWHAGHFSVRRVRVWGVIPGHPRMWYKPWCCRYKKIRPYTGNCRLTDISISGRDICSISSW